MSLVKYMPLLWLCSNEPEVILSIIISKSKKYLTLEFNPHIPSNSILNEALCTLGMFLELSRQFGRYCHSISIFKLIVE